ncbi:hypothetical protein [Mycoplasma crocodyli]|nr:hypothetical protein [Mycoplasma crocodyli]
MIKTKSINFTPHQYDNTNIQDELIDINKNLLSKNIVDFENLEFNDIAFNYSISGITKIINMCKNLQDNCEDRLEELFIFAPSYHINNILSALNFLYGESYQYKKNSIKITFFEHYESSDSLQQKLNYLNSKIKRNYGIIVLGELDKNKYFTSFVKKVFADVQSSLGPRFLKNNIFIIGKYHTVNLFKNIKINPYNIFVTPDNISDNNAFFTENTLFPLALIGVDILKLVKGYKETSLNSTSIDLENNLALKLASNLFHDLYNFGLDRTHLNIIGSESKRLKNILDIHLFNQNIFNISRDIVSIGFYGNENIHTQGQMLIDGNKNKSIIYFVVDGEDIDYQPSSEVDVVDGFYNLEINSLNKLKNDSYVVFRDYLSSFSANIKILEISLSDYSEETLGNLIALIYYLNIYYACLVGENPFINHK